MVYLTTNITQLVNSTNFFEVIQFTSDSTGGMFWFFVVIALFMILVINLRKYGVENAFIASSFACMILSSLLYSIGLIPTVIIPIAFGVGGVAAVVFAKMYGGE